jgi:anti-sigma regulatory factor (Ser/Thr protein kinase)
MYATIADVERRSRVACASRERPASQAASGPGTPVYDGTWPLEHSPHAAGAARRIARSVLDDWRTHPESAEHILLVVSELVTNAVEHAQPPVAMHLHRERIGSKMWVGITDGGPAQAEGRWTSSCGHDEHGRGLTVIDALATAHGTRRHPEGSATHWARLPVESAVA